MTEDRALTPNEHADLLAAEFVIGVLPLADRAAAEARLRRDEGFAARVAAWENHLSDLNGDYAEVEPPADVLTRTEAQLFPAAIRRRQVWFGWLSGAAAAAALAIVAVIFLSPPPAGDAPLIATLGEPDAPLAFEARYDGASLIVARVAGTAPGPGQAYELWIIAPTAAPVSLGLLGDAPLAIPYPTPPAGWTLAVSLEPEGGSPTGLPTGPVVAAGEVTDL